MQMPRFMGMAIGRALMEAHGIWKSGFEQIVVTNGDAAEDIAEKIALVRVELVERRNMAFAQNERFERPDRPKRHENGERIVLAHYALVSLQLYLEVIAQQARMPFGVIGTERFIFAGREIRQRGVRPYLAVRMRVAGAH